MKSGDLVQYAGKAKHPPPMTPTSILIHVSPSPHRYMNYPWITMLCEDGCVIGPMSAKGFVTVTSHENLNSEFRESA